VAGAARAEAQVRYQELYGTPGLQDWIRRQAARMAPGSWILVPRNEITRLKERRFPTLEELDAAATSHPVQFVSVKKSVFNTAGWQALGIPSANGSYPEGVDIVFENGKPGRTVFTR
jgi:predicted amidohydrolase YtcJ